MRIYALLVSALLVSSSFGQNSPQVSPMPTMAPRPSGPFNTATYPDGRFEWFAYVKNTIDQGKAAAAGCQLVFDGDSITDFWKGPGKAVWAEHYAKYNAFDFGISGDQTQHLLWRLSQGQAEGMHPKLIALMIGTNNINSSTVEEIADGVKAIVQAYQKRCPDAVILLQAIFPRAEKPEDPARAKIKQINQIISKLGDDKKVIYIDFGDKFLEPDGTMSKEIMGDFLHPTPKGYQIWADAIQPVIDKYLGAK